MTGSAQRQIGDLIRQKGPITTPELARMTGRQTGDVYAICRTLLKWGDVIQTYEETDGPGNGPHLVCIWHWVG